MPQSFKVESLNHTGFTVSDLDDTVRFFIECFACELEVRQPVPKAMRPRRSKT